MSETHEAPAARLAHYLEAFDARLRRLIWLRGGSAVMAVALVLTLAASWLAIRTGFAPGTLAVARGVLLAALVLSSAAFVGRPLRRLRRERPRIIEAITREFDGRLQTFADLPAQHPFRQLLAQDALSIAARHAARAHIGVARLAASALAVALPALALLWLAAAGPGLYRDGTRALWAGWLSGGLLPAERLAVEPGDQAVRRGGSVTVRSFPQGFDPPGAQLHARVGGGPWQQIDMAREAGGFSFTLFSMRERVSYYVSAAGVRSPAYTLSVVDVPVLERLRLVYRYPGWTHLPERVQEGDGDISAIAGTRVQVQLHASAALPATELVLDGAASPMQTLGQDGQGQLQVTRDARYYLAARIGAERVRLSNDYLIRLLPVSAPSVRVAWPGRDYSASSIEEVTTDVQASDAYGLQSLQLRYSINGGVWHVVTLPAAGATASEQHVFSLESLRPDGVGRALAPGDLISYYAIARGPQQSAQSDLYFIDVQPFDRRYSQSQAAGGAGDDDSEQQQISERQRQILLSTWNLLRGQQSGGAASAAIHDNAGLLATLQTKLATQAQALAGRTQARELSSDPKVARFIDSMRHAAAAMRPAAARLGTADLAAAVAPEQQALQYLLQAQSQFTDVRIALQRGGSAAQSGRDVSQIYQLEMDLHKNQYESGEGASPNAQDAQGDELARRLQSLAQRQRQLANQMQRAGAPSPEQRWQQQSLQREAEDLKQQLDAQARSGAPSSAQGSAASSPQGTPGASGQGAGTPLGQRLEAAIRAMGAAGGTPGGGGAAGAVIGGDALEAARRAQQALSDAAAELARQRAQSLQQTVSQLADRAAQLYAQQAAAARVLQSPDAAQTLAQRALADQKRELSAGVRRLGDQIGAAARAHRADASATAAALARAQEAISETDLVNRLDIAAQYLDQGGARALTPGESQVTQSLAELHRRLQAAAGIAGQGILAASAPADPLTDELSRLRALRSQLAQAADAAQSGAPRATAAQASTSVAAGAARLEPLLRARGADAREIATIERLARTLGASPPPVGRSPDLQRLRGEVDLLDALELQLERSAQSPEAIRAAVADRGAEQYQSAVAEYYRQLSRQ